MNRFIEKIKNIFTKKVYCLDYSIFHKPKKYKYTIVFIHGIGNSIEAWQNIVKQMPDECQVIAINLLGFGKSPKPKKDTLYTNENQAKCTLKTLKKIGVKKNVILVGHSLGSIVSLEIAKTNPNMISNLILCSPPIYKTKLEAKNTFIDTDLILKNIYKMTASDIEKKPESYIKLAKFLRSTGIVPAINVNKDVIFGYVHTLRNSIINQNVYDFIYEINTPIKVIYGKLDFFINVANLKALAKHNSKISLKSIYASHEIKKRYNQEIIKEINKIINNDII